MKKWIAASVAMAVLMLTVIAGCGAKMPTVSEDTQGDPNEQKIEVLTEYNDDVVVGTID
ncbi:MAG: hypothetical protein V3W18_13390 [candidate division Zixibacteria bacterium]